MCSLIIVVFINHMSFISSFLGEDVTSNLVELAHKGGTRRKRQAIDITAELGIDVSFVPEVRYDGLMTRSLWLFTCCLNSNSTHSGKIFNISKNSYFTVTEAELFFWILFLRFLVRLHFSAEELLLYPQRLRPRQCPCWRPHAKC